MYFEKPYYLEPEKTAIKAYSLLRESLRLSKKVGLAKCILRNHERVGVVRPYGSILVWNQMRLYSEIRNPNGITLPSEPALSEKEIELATDLIGRMTEKFKPEKYTDKYTDQLLEYIEKKAKGKKVPAAAAPSRKASKVHDIMSLLKESLAREKPKGKAKSKVG